MASKKKPEAEAGNQRRGKVAAPSEAEPGGKKKAKTLTAASTKAAGKKASKKKSSRKKTASKKVASKKSAAPIAEGVAEDPFEIAKQTMKGSVSAIVEAMVEKAKRGSCSHAKTLLEMTGAKHMFGDAAETEDRGEPWAKLVLERMDEAEAESLKERPTEDLPDFAVE